MTTVLAVNFWVQFFWVTLALVLVAVAALAVYTWISVWRDK